jgi:hypothetical protein
MTTTIALGGRLEAAATSTDEIEAFSRSTRRQVQLSEVVTHVP